MKLGEVFPARGHGRRRGMLAPVILLVLAMGAVQALAQTVPNGSKQLTLIHLSDIHGKMAPHPERFGDGRVYLHSGGLAKLYTKIKEIRRQTPGRNLLLMDGDIFHGSGEAFFTRGKIMVPIINEFGIDAHTPGNWDYGDGPKAFRERFQGLGGKPPLVNFPLLAADLYNGPGAPEGAKVGERIFPPYIIRDVNGVRVAILGLTTGKVAGQARVRSIGFRFASAFEELPPLIREVRDRGAEVVVLLTETPLYKSVALARDIPGIDIVLGADTHEHLYRPIIVQETGSIVVESGEDAYLGQLDLTVRDGRVVEHRWKLHEINDNVPEDPRIKAMVERARAPFLSGPAFRPHLRTIPGWPQDKGYVLNEPLDTVIGHTDTFIERRNVLEDVANDVAADALRELSGADIGITNGFRFDVPVAAGEITLGDALAYFPLGGHIAVGEMTGGQILHRMEEFLTAVFDPNPYRREGGWMPAVSGIRFDLDLTGPAGISGGRIVKAEVRNRDTGEWEPLVEDKVYTVASCHPPGDPLDRICRTSGVRNLRFLTRDLRLVPPLVDHQRPNPEPKVQVAPDDAIFGADLMRKYLEVKGGWIRAADYPLDRWKVVKGEVPVSVLNSNIVQPLQGVGPDWLAGERITDRTAR